VFIIVMCCRLPLGSLNSSAMPRGLFSASAATGFPPARRSAPQPALVVQKTRLIANTALPPASQQTYPTHKYPSYDCDAGPGEHRKPFEGRHDLVGRNFFLF